MTGAVHDVTTHANLSEHRLSYFVYMAWVLAFSIDLRSSRYNTLALPCECVMIMIQSQFVRLYTVLHKRWTKSILNPIALS